MIAPDRGVQAAIVQMGCGAPGGWLHRVLPPVCSGGITIRSRTLLQTQDRMAFF